MSHLYSSLCWSVTLVVRDLEWEKEAELEQGEASSFLKMPPPQSLEPCLA